MANVIKMVIAALKGRFHVSEREREYRMAIRELQAYSGEELDCIGLSRSDIETAVRHGTDVLAKPM